MGVDVISHLSSFKDLCSSLAHLDTSPFLVSQWRGLATCEKSCTKCWYKLMNPMKDWTSVTFLGVGQSWTPATLTGSISTWPSERMRLRYSNLGCLKIHFSTLRYSLCFQRKSRTFTTME